MGRSPDPRMPAPQAPGETLVQSDKSTIMTLFAGAFCALLLLALPAHPQSARSAMPANASAKTYGEGWECNIGFRPRGDACAAVVVPENAYFDNGPYSIGWLCKRGFAPTGQTCEAIELPVNAHLARTGNRWECNKNFQKLKDQCVLNN